MEPGIERALQDLGFPSEKSVQRHDVEEPRCSIAEIKRRRATALMAGTTHIAFGGGGMMCISYAGVLIELFNDSRVEWVKFLERLEGCSGSSMGAVIAVTVATGLSPWELAHVTLNTDFSSAGKQMDLSTLVGSIPSLIRSGGVDSGEKLAKLLKTYLTKLIGWADITFREFHARYKRHVTMVAFDLSRSTEVRMGTADTPDMMVRDALAASMAIPFYFELKNQTGKGYLADGCICNGYPMNVFGTPETTLGIFSNTIFLRGKRTPMGLVRGGMEAQLHRTVECIPTMLNRIIFVDVPSIALDFSMTHADKCSLIKDGEDATVAFLLEDIIFGSIVHEIAAGDGRLVSPHAHVEVDREGDLPGGPPVEASEEEDRKV